MKDFTLLLSTGESIEFFGKHLSERETGTWTYFEDEDRAIYKIRKEDLIGIIEKPYEG